MKASYPIIGLLLTLAVIVGCKQNKNQASAQNVGATIAGNNQKTAEAPITSQPIIKDIPLDYGLNDDEYIAETPGIERRVVIAIEHIDKEKIKYIPINGKALLVGDNIYLRNDDYDIVEDISTYNTKVVNLISATQNLFCEEPEDDYCKTYRGVKISTEEFEGIVDGKNVYMPELKDSTQGKAVLVNGKKVIFAGTSFFGIDVADEDGLTFCYERYYPMYFYDEETGYEGVVKVVKNDFYNQIYSDSFFPYFQLEASDGAYDKI